MQTNVLDAKSAAERLGVSHRTVMNFIERGRFPGAYRLDPKMYRSPWRIPVEDVLRLEMERQGWVEEGSVQAE